MWRRVGLRYMFVDTESGLDFVFVEAEWAEVHINVPSTLSRDLS